MKIKTSLTLSEDLVAALDRMAGPGASRSALIERILRDYMKARARARREARDVALLNRHAEKLNEEMADILSFQAAAAEE